MADKVNVGYNCHCCSNKQTFFLNEEGFRSWQGGELIQRALPGLNSNEREALILNYCVKCVIKLYERFKKMEEQK